MNNLRPFSQSSNRFGIFLSQQYISVRTKQTQSGSGLMQKRIDRFIPDLFRSPLCLSLAQRAPINCPPCRQFSTIKKTPAVESSSNRLTYGTKIGGKSGSNGNSHSGNYLLGLAAGVVGLLGLQSEEEERLDRTLAERDPLSIHYFDSLRIEKGHKDYIIQAYKDREACLNIKGFSDEEIEGLARWLETHTHCFMLLEGQPAFTDQLSPPIASIQACLKENKDRYQDRVSDKQCAEFACLAYEELDEIKRQLPEGWEVLKDSDHRDMEVIDRNGYHGIALINHQTRQLIIAHEGTTFPHEPASFKRKFVDEIVGFLKDLKSDYSEVASKKLGGAQGAAIDFSNQVRRRLDGYHYTVGCVGHSLGGWLAQITACDLKYESKGSNPDVYAVCLDSPGAAEIIQNYFCKKNSSAKGIELDVVNYVFLPNLVNTCGTPLGTTYLLCVTEAEKELAKTKKNEVTYISFSHDKRRIANAIGEEGRRVLRVEHWPSLDWNRFTKDDPVTMGMGLVNTLFELATSPLTGVVKIATGAISAKAEYQSITTGYSTLVEQLLFGESGSYFKDRHVSSYKATEYDPKKCSLANTFKDSKKFLERLAKLKENFPEPGHNLQALASFLKQKAREEGLDPDEFDLSLLAKQLSVNLDTEMIKVNAAEFSAQELRSKIDLLLRCYPRFKAPMDIQYTAFLRNGYHKDLRGQSFSICPADSQKNRVSESHLQTLTDMHAQNRFLSLFGPEGTGKSTLAKAYANDYLEAEKGEGRTAAILYFDCSTSLENRWRRLAIRLGIYQEEPHLPNLVNEVYKRLRAFDSFLLIFDGINDLREIEAYTQRMENSKVLLLTSNPCISHDFHNQSMHSSFCLGEREVIGLLGDDGQALRKDVVKALTYSPLASHLLGRFFAHEKRVEVRNELLQNLNLDKAKILDSLVENILDSEFNQGQSEATLGHFAYSISPFLHQSKFDKNLIKDWVDFDPVECAHRERSFDLIASVLNDSADDEYIEINPAIFTLLQPRLPLEKMDFAHRFSKFLSRKFNDDNRQTGAVQKNRLLSPIPQKLWNLLGYKEGTIADSVALLNAAANHYLQTERYKESEEIFKQVQAICEEAGGISVSIGKEVNFAEAKDIFAKLKQIDSALAIDYADSFHCLGKMYFQFGEKQRANDYFNMSLNLSAPWEELFKNEEFIKRERAGLKSLIFKRNGTGWALAESEEAKGLLEAKDLYLKLCQQRPVDNFFQYYCNYQLGKIYRKLGQFSLPDAAPAHYFKKSLEHLETGGTHKGISFQGALPLAEREGKQKLVSDILLQIGILHADEHNPNRDFKKAIQTLIRVTKAKEKGTKAGEIERLDAKFMAYYHLAQLYKSEAITQEQMVSRNKLDFYKERSWSYSIEGLMILAESPEIQNKRKKEIKELVQLAEGAYLYRE